MSLLRDDNGIVLSMFRGKKVRYPNMFHVGFIQPNEESVDAINRRGGVTTSGLTRNDPLTPSPRSRTDH